MNDVGGAHEKLDNSRVCVWGGMCSMVELMWFGSITISDGLTLQRKHPACHLLTTSQDLANFS